MKIFTNTICDILKTVLLTLTILGQDTIMHWWETVQREACYILCCNFKGDKGKPLINKAEKPRCFKYLSLLNLLMYSESLIKIHY